VSGNDGTFNDVHGVMEVRATQPRLLKTKHEALGNSYPKSIFISSMNQSTLSSHLESTMTVYLISLLTF